MEQNKIETDFSLLDKLDTSLTVMVFDTGEKCYFDDEHWPFAEAIGFYQEDEPDNINPNSFEVQGFPPY